MKENWVLRLREQCQAAGVAFFFKQWGGVKKSEAGRELENRIYDAMPDRPVRRVPAHKIRLGMIDEVRMWEADYELPVSPSESPEGDRQAFLF